MDNNYTSWLHEEVSILIGDAFRSQSEYSSIHQILNGAYTWGYSDESNINADPAKDIASGHKYVPSLKGYGRLELLVNSLVDHENRVSRPKGVKNLLIFTGWRR